MGKRADAKAEIGAAELVTLDPIAGGEKIIAMRITLRRFRIRGGPGLR